MSVIIFIIFILLCLSPFIYLYSNKKSLVKKGDSFNIPKEAYNIHLYDVDGITNNRCFGRGEVYLETKNGFITKETYKPDKMKNVIAIYLGLKDINNIYKRIDVKDIVEFEDNLENMPDDLFYKLKNIYPGIGSVHTIKIGEKKSNLVTDIYTIHYIEDIDSKDESRELLFDEAKSDVEKFNGMLEKSCMWALYKHINDSHRNNV